MIFKITQKVAKHFDIDELSSIENDSSNLNEWYTNIFNAGRYKYFITTNSETLYSVIMNFTGLKSDSDYLKHFFSRLHEHFTDLNCEQVFEEYIIPESKLIKFRKTDNKSILGSMLDIVKIAKYYLQIKELSVFDATNEINECIFGYIKSKPIEMIKKYKDKIT